jgi:glycine/D-amino acid oxidase-like deaminating enzyme
VNADVVICGAGIAGIAAAYQLAVVEGRQNILLIDEGPPLALTSDKSTECYRNWWPGPDADMTALSNRSIDLMEGFAEHTHNGIQMDRRGYLFLSAQAERGNEFETTARAAASVGAGPMRIHQGQTNHYQPAQAGHFKDQPTGSDVFHGTESILRNFPYLNPNTSAALHTRRCGALSAQQLGMLMLEQARLKGLKFLRGRVAAVNTTGGRVQGVTVETDDRSETIHCPNFINAAGPYLNAVAQLMEIELPVVCERHIKLTFNDRQAILPRDAPLLLWTDPTPLPWNSEERELIAEDPEMESMLQPFPAGVHGRPIGAGDSVMLYWTYDCPVETPQFPLQPDPQLQEILIRGMSVMIPGLECYFQHLPKAFMDGGYYTKTPDNCPLIGELPIEGAWIAGAYSGFGIMIAMAAGELLAAQIYDRPLPSYAQAFNLDRFTQSAEQPATNSDAFSGQL